MAIDLFIMPLTRYWARDYITPTMRAVWDRGLPYKVVTPDGVLDCPPGQPFGGPDSPAERQAMLAEAPQFFADLRAVSSDPPWDESDDRADIGDWRVDPASFDELLVQIERELPKVAGPLGRPGYSAHLRFATIFLPAVFQQVFDFSGAHLGSLPVARKELDAINPKPAARGAFAMLGDAIDEALRRRLPLIVDG
jgi:hypothetical protein